MASLHNIFTPFQSPPVDQCQRLLKHMIRYNLSNNHTALVSLLNYSAFLSLRSNSRHIQLEGRGISLSHVFCCFQSVLWASKSETKAYWKEKIEESWTPYGRVGKSREGQPCQAETAEAPEKDPKATHPQATQTSQKCAPVPVYIPKPSKLALYLSQHNAILLPSQHHIPEEISEQNSGVKFPVNFCWDLSARRWGGTNLQEDGIPFFYRIGEAMFKVCFSLKTSILPQI